MRFTLLSLLVVIALSSGCGGGSPVSGSVSLAREGVTTHIHPTVCIGTSGSLSASEDGGNAVVVSVAGFRPGQALPPTEVVIQTGGASTRISSSTCPNMTGSFTLTPTGEQTATVSGTLHLDCPAELAVGDLTFDGCEITP